MHNEQYSAELAHPLRVLGLTDHFRFHLGFLILQHSPGTNYVLRTKSSRDRQSESSLLHVRDRRFQTIWPIGRDWEETLQVGGCGEHSTEPAHL